jgi:hypothetical protein
LRRELERREKEGEIIENIPPYIEKVIFVKTNR